MVSQFDAAAPTWDAEHGPASARAAEFIARLRYLRGLCSALGRPRVLDLGCGTGQTLLHLDDVIADGLGIDIAPAMIAKARRNGDTALVRFRVGDAADFCARCSERFDLVLLVGALEHFADPVAMLAGAKRVLAADGRLVVIMPHPWGPAFRLSRLLTGSRDAPPARHLSLLRLRALAACQGLELAAIQALPYTPWSSLAAALDGRISASTPAWQCKFFAGMLRGAYGAELCHRS